MAPEDGKISTEGNKPEAFQALKNFWQSKQKTGTDETKNTKPKYQHHQKKKEKVERAWALDLELARKTAKSMKDDNVEGKTLLLDSLDVLRTLDKYSPAMIPDKEKGYCKAPELANKATGHHHTKLTPPKVPSEPSPSNITSAPSTPKVATSRPLVPILLGAMAELDKDDKGNNHNKQGMSPLVLESLEILRALDAYFPETPAQDDNLKARQVATMVTTAGVELATVTSRDEDRAEKKAAFQRALQELDEFLGSSNETGSPPSRTKSNSSIFRPRRNTVRVDKPAAAAKRRCHLPMIDEEIFCDGVLSYIHPRRLPAVMVDNPELSNMFHLKQHFCIIHGHRLKKDKYQIDNTARREETQPFQDWSASNPFVNPTSCGRCYLLSTGRDKCNQCTEIREWQDFFTCVVCQRSKCQQCCNICHSFCGGVVCTSCAQTCANCQDTFCGQRSEAFDCRVMPCGSCKKEQLGKLCYGCQTSHRRYDCSNPLR